jgi:hypothetical protein
MSHLVRSQHLLKSFTMLRGSHNDDCLIALQSLCDEAGYRLRQEHVVIVKLNGMV